MAELVKEDSRLLIGGPVDYSALIRKELDDMTPYTPGLRASELRKRFGRDDFIKVSSNEYHAGPVPEALRAIAALSSRVNRYPDGSARALKRRIAKWLDVDHANVAVGAGSNELIRLIAQAVLRPGDEVVFSWPSFVVYPMVAQMFGATAVRVPLSETDTHDLDRMLQAITERTRIVFLCNPNNPTGTIYHRLAFERFLSEVPEHVLVVADEAYFEFVTDEHFPDALEYFDGSRPLCVLRTFSKIYSLAGLRIGYGVLPEPVRVAVDKLREPFNTNMLGQIAAYYSMMAYDEIDRRTRENAECRTRLCEAFDELGFEYAASQANFVYLKCDRPKELFEALLGEGIIVRDFGDTPALRVTVASPEDTDAVIEAFESASARLGGNV